MGLSKLHSLRVVAELLPLESVRGHAPQAGIAIVQIPAIDALLSRYTLAIGLTIPALALLDASVFLLPDVEERVHALVDAGLQGLFFKASSAAGEFSKHSLKVPYAYG